MTRRVVVTGLGLLSALGDNWADVRDNLLAAKSAVRFMPEWKDFQGLKARIAAPIDGFEMPSHYHRKQTRSMDLVARYAVYAAEQALSDAGILDNKLLLGSGRVGAACGSSAGGAAATTLFAKSVIGSDYGQLTPNTYIKMAPHTALVNLAITFGMTGRLIPTSTACTSSTQAIGFSYEAIVSGAQDVMLAGGTEELNTCQLAVFDNVFSASIQNDAPHTRPAPFDVCSDGLVMGEGAGMLVLEEYEHAKARGATIYAEILSFSTNNDAFHITQPRVETMQRVIQESLDMAGIQPTDVDYISAHGTAAFQSDKAESEATHAVFGSTVPVSTLKSYLGHSLGACGGMEAVTSLKMLQEGWFHPTLNLTEPNPEFAELDHIMGSARHIAAETIQLNNFAFGGINTSLIMRRI